jgi:nucleotidyltransferase substrate binding protein (TIGR01987 family)
MKSQIRWQQRLENYEKACQQLLEFIEHGPLNKFEKQGLVQCFEYTFELAWKTLKDYLESEGYEPKTPRASIQLGFKIELIDDGHLWIQALEKRNLLSHTYNNDFLNESVEVILAHYAQMLFDLKSKMTSLRA